MPNGDQSPGLTMPCFPLRIAWSTSRNKQETDGSRHSTAPPGTQKRSLRLSFSESPSNSAAIKTKKIAQSMLEEGQSICSMESRQAWTRPEPPKRLILLSPSGDFNGSAQLQIFSPLRMRADLNNFWWTWEQTWRTFGNLEFSPFWQKKSEFTTEISPCWLPGWSQVNKKLFKSARILSGEKICRFLVGSACSTVGVGLGPAHRQEAGAECR